jgi:hypothetical protein
VGRSTRGNTNAKPIAPARTGSGVGSSQDVAASYRGLPRPRFDLPMICAA